MEDLLNPGPHWKLPDNNELFIVIDCRPTYIRKCIFASKNDLTDVNSGGDKLFSLIY